MQPEAVAAPGPGVRGSAQRWRQALRPANAGILYGFALLVATLTALTHATGRPNYLAGVNVANVLDQTSLAGIIVVFMTIVLISGNFDLSVGSVAAFSGALGLSVIGHYGLAVALLVALGSGAAVGLLNGVIVQFVGVNAFIVTLGTMTAVRGLLLILAKGQQVTAQDPGSLAALSWFEEGTWTTPNLLIIIGGLLALVGVWPLLVRSLRGSRGRPRIGVKAGGALVVGVSLGGLGVFEDWAWTLTKPVYYMLALTLLTWLVLKFTVVGRRLYAVGGNTEAARLSGINVNRYRIVAFVLSGLAAAFAGVLFGARYSSITPSSLSGVELTVLAAAILGGTSLFGGSGSVLKSLVGALFLFTLANGFNVLNLGPNYQGLIQGSVVIIAAAVYTLSGRNRGTRRKRETAVEVAAIPSPPASERSEALSR